MDHSKDLIAPRNSSRTEAVGCEADLSVMVESEGIPEQSITLEILSIVKRNLLSHTSSLKINS